MENREFVSERVPQPYHTLDKWRVEASDSIADTWSRVPLKADTPLISWRQHGLQAPRPRMETNTSISSLVAFVSSVLACTCSQGAPDCVSLAVAWPLLGKVVCRGPSLVSTALLELC